MPSQWIASSDSSPATVEPPPNLAGCCTRESHESQKDLVRTWLEYRNNWPEQLPAWLAALTSADQRWLGGWLKTQRPWPETTLLLAECPLCKSTLAVCSDCRDEGVVEKGEGPGVYETPCTCVYGEEVAA